MGMKIRLTALILAASLTVNMVTLPVKAEEDTVPMEQQTTVTEPSTEDSSASGTGVSAAEPVEAKPAPTASTAPASVSAEATVPATEATAPATEATAPATEATEPATEATVSETEPVVLPQPDPPEEELILETEGTTSTISVPIDGEGVELTPSGIKALIDALTPPAPYDPGTIIKVENAEQLAILSGIDAKIYQHCVLYIINSSTSFDTTKTDFNSLGKEESFSGAVRLADATNNPIVLNVPLFKNLSDSAEISNLILQYAKEGDTGNTAILAENVTHIGTSDTGIGDWTITLPKPQDEAEMTDIVSTCLIETIDEGCNISLSVTDNIGKPVISDGNAGFLCGTLKGSLTLKKLERAEPISVTAKSGNAGGLVGEMGENASLTVTLDKVTVDGVPQPATLMIDNVTATLNAGGLVGKMAAGASLTINTNVEISGSVTTTGGDAGGLVGLAEDGSTADTPKTVTIKAVTSGESEPVTNPALTLSSISNITGTGNVGGLIGKATDIIFDGGLPTVDAQSATITGANAGGLIGDYTYTGNAYGTTPASGLYEVDAVIATGTVTGVIGTGGNAGGVFGVLRNNSLSDTFTISSNTVSTKLATGASDGNAGGLIGQYSAAHLDAALQLSPTQVTAELTGSASAFGGLIGWVSGESAYLELSGTVTLKGTAQNYGGLIGSFYDGDHKDSGHMVVVSAVTIKKKGDGPIKGTEKAGGLIGYQPHGVLKLDGIVDDGKVPVETPVCDNKANLGNILGYRDNTLVYSTSQWTPMDGGKNDIGNWGQVLSIPDICDNITDLLTEAGHKVIVTAATSYNLGTKLDFAKVALGLQLASKGALEVSTISGDLAITLTKDINLTGTGLTSFQRDIDVTAYSVTLNGDGHTITLPGIKTYVYSGAHDYQGLFSKVTNLVAENLTISGGGSYTEGNTTISNVGIQLECNNNFYVGGLAADASGDISLTNVTAGASIITSNGGAAIGGLVGRRSFASADPGELTCTNCSWTSTIRVSGNNSGIYVGGLVGRVDNEGKPSAPMTMVFRNCTISGMLNRTGAPNDARIGGMLGACYGRRSKDTDPLCFDLQIDGVKVDGATVTSDATSEMGGLLSLEWLDTNVTLTNVTVKNSTVSSTNTGTASSFGGLVFKAMGYCKIGDTVTDENGVTTTIPGVTIESGTFSGPSPSTAPSALLICHGEERGSLPNALYLEILDGAYKITNPTQITLTLNNSSRYFDEIIGTTFGDKVNNKGNGIVSIATSDDLIDTTATGCNTYKKQLNTDYDNPNTRYYYNLDSFGAAGDVVNGRTVPSGVIDSPEKMVMFSAYSHAYKGIKEYFYKDVGIITNPSEGGKILDLTGYSYYPAEEYAIVQDATIKFDFQGIETRESTPSENKKPSNANRQHAGMHTGIFTGVSGKSTLNVNNLTLQGTVSGLGNNFGALIRDNAQGGSDTSNMADLKINGVTLDGIIMVGTPDTGVKPLLIHSLGSYTTLNMSGVATIGYVGDVKAASSLIGNVGSDTGVAINLTFSDMALDGKQQANNRIYNEKDSIFSRALFLESFRYSESNCSGVYNFGTDAERYTVGRELSNTGGGNVDGRNNGAQYWFHNSDTLVCGDDTNKGTYYQEYLRYVRSVEGKPDAKSHEIDVNVRTFGLTEGCGTYSHPYIITDGNQLKELAEVLNSGGKKEGWKVNLSEAVKDKSFSNQNGHTASSTAGEIDCVTYTGRKTNWSGTKDGKLVTANNDVVLKYLRNAYYVIRGKESAEPGKNEITLSGTWAGLGGGDTSTAFSGVIVGEGDVTVKIVRSDLGQQFGGLIKYSQGSVVKNLTIAYTETPTVTANGAPTSNSDASFFGGVVGWCLGGDTIIDNVKVTMSGTPTVTGTYPHLTAVGGYVGMVGGGGPDVKYGGGVVFRNMTDSTGMTGGNTAADSKYFYVNPFVGRVLDGYAMLEEPTKSGYLTQLNNTDKNYTIPTISEGTHLTRAGETVTVHDAQGLWLLSAIANSGAGSMVNHDNYNNNFAYRYGKPRTGTYSSIGEAIEGADKTDEGFLGGADKKKETQSYLTQAKYVNGNLYDLCSSNGVSIVLNSDCDMSVEKGFGNGFRGIGASYATPANGNSNYRLIPVSSVNGNDHTVTLGQSRKEYTEEGATWTSIGSGLFVLLKVADDGNFKASNLNFAGTTGISYYKKGNGIVENTTPTTNCLNKDNRLTLAASGMLAANLAKNGTTIASFELDTVSITGASDEKATVNGTGTGSVFAGGFIGLLYNDVGNGITDNRTYSIAKVVLTDCTYENLLVKGNMNVGGFVGLVVAGETKICYRQEETLTNGEFCSTLGAANPSTEFGVGGLIGRNVGSMSINGAKPDETPPPWLKFENLTVDSNHSSNAADKAHAGGLVGLWHWRDSKNGSAVIRNISMQGSVLISGGNVIASNSLPQSTTGGLVGAIQYKPNTWDDGGKRHSLTLSGIRMATETIAGKDSRMIVKNGRQVAGLFGILILDGQVRIDDVILGGGMCSVTVANNHEFDYQTAAALIAIAVDMENAKISNTQINNTKVLVRGKSNRGVGLVIGYAEKGPTKIDLKNLTLNNSVVAVDTDTVKTGLLYGMLNNDGDHLITGANILVKDCMVGYILQKNSNGTYGLDTAFDKTGFEPDINNIGLKKDNTYQPYSVLKGKEAEVKDYASTTMGIFGGDSNNKTVKLVGVSIQEEKYTQNTTLPMAYFATNYSNCVVTRADYMGYQDGTHGSSPFVTTSPLSKLAITDKTITGDGASFKEKDKPTDPDTPVASVILSDLGSTDKLNLKHAAAKAYNDSEKRTAYKYLLDNTDKTKFGPFSTEGGNGENYTGPDFPVLVLVTNSSIEANSLLYSWISLLTNRDIKPTTSSDYTITATNYRWNGNSWVKDDSATKKSFTWTGTGIQLTKGTYDSAQNRFTLLDVAFKDPADNTKDAYHLYIPVVMQKIMKFHFWASAQTGTSYIKSTYDSLSALAAASHGEQVTVLVGYDYFERDRAKWDEAIANGDSLLFGFNKTLLLDQGLPNGTRLTLVDCSQQNRAYYATWNAGNELKFKDFVDSDGKPWAPLQLWQMLDLQATAGNGKYYIESSEEAATLKAKCGDTTLTLKYYSDDETPPQGATSYSVSIPEGQVFPLAERYYLTIQTIQTQGNTETVRNNFIKCPSSLGASGLPTLRESNPDGQPYARNYAENRVLIGNFFEHGVAITTTRSDPEMSTAKNNIDVKLDATLEFLVTDEEKGTTSKEFFNDYTGEQSLYQRFELSMQEWDKDGESQPRTMLPGTRITAKFFLDGIPKGTYSDTIGIATSSYYLDFPAVLIRELTGSEENSFTFSADVTLEYPDATLVDQFPEIQNPGPDNRQGIVLGAGSYLAYTEETRSTTTLHANTEWLNSPRFYRGTYSAASLNYYPVVDGVENVNQLGVNGFLSSSQKISSAAYYDISALDRAKDADSIQCTLKLYRKVGNNYTLISDWANYLKDGGMAVKISHNGQEATAVSGNGGIYTITVTDLDKDKLVEIEVDMEVLTGSAFEGNTLTYANYKVELEAVLKKDNADITGSRAIDHIVYTNAKINPNPVRP